jgi:hypothetical protein
MSEENDESLMTKNGGKSNEQIVGRLCQTPWRFAETPYNYSGFVILSSFVIRHSAFAFN